jgi:hypothetical protein
MVSGQWTLFVCRACGAFDFAREEVWHFSNQCPGRAQTEELVVEVTVVPSDGPDRAAASSGTGGREGRDLLA